MANNPSLQVRRARWPDDEPILQELRSIVFIAGQGVPVDIEWDGKDSAALHAIAEVDGAPVGCGRILDEGRIGRLAVLEAYRGQGIGAAVLAELLAIAADRGLPSVYLHAQTDAVAFYERAGFVAHGDPFMEANIQHLEMSLTIDYRDRDEPVSGLAYPKPFDQLAVAQVRLAGREVRILSPRLDPAVFDGEEFLSAARSFVRRSRQSRIRILVEDARALVQRSHGLLTLTRRLPSSIEMRRLAEHPDWNGDTQVIRDRDSLLDLPAAAESPAFYRPGDRASTEQALDRFDELWRAGVEDPEFRALAL